MRVHEGTDGWRAGIEASIRKVNYRQSVMPDLQTAAYKQGLADVLLHLEAMLARNTENSTTVVMDPPLEAWRASIAAAIGGETADIKTVKELLECSPIGACETHGRCWTHSEWQRCGSLIRSVSSDPCQAIVDGLDGLCSGCRAFEAMCAQHDEEPRRVD